MKPKNFYEELKEYIKNTPKEQIKKDWEETKEYENVGPLISDMFPEDEDTKYEDEHKQI